MLPSTGYFKAINCPFYDSGSCDRPYCHFKHARREDVGNAGATAGSAEARTTGQTQESKTSDSNVLQRLVTEAVKKVLANHEGATADKLSEDVVNEVVEELSPGVSSTNPTIENKPVNAIGKHLDMPVSITKPVACVYNPTPIAELKKRHIPIVSYMPTRESRPAVKRKSSPDRPKPWLNIVHDSSDSHSNEITYKPTAIVNINEQGYVPTYKTDSSVPSSYEDGNSNDYLSKFKEIYHPKSKKRREEYVPKKVKAPLTGQLESNTLDIMDEIFTGSINTPRAPLSEDSQESSMDVEPKFSDDESMEDIPSIIKKPDVVAINNLGSISNEGINKIDINEKLTQKPITELSKKSEVQEKPEQKDTVVSHNKNELNKKTEVKENEVKESKKEHRQRDRSRSKDRKSRSSSSSHKSSKDKYKDKHKSSSDRKSRSSSQNRDKDKNRDNHRSKSSSSRKDKSSSSSEKSKDEHRKSDKHHRHESKSSSSKSSRSKKHSSEKSSDKRHSSSSQKSSRHSSKKSKSHESSTEERCHSDGSSEDVRLSLDTGDGLIDENGVNEIDDDEILSISDSDHDVQEECLKIFQEYQVSEQPKPVSIKESKREEDTNEDVGKKRVAHPSAATSASRQVGRSHTAKKLATPQEKMYERWRLMREAAAEKSATEAKPSQITETSSISSIRPASTVSSEGRSESLLTRGLELQQLNGNGRIRIAHVPYARSLELEKKKVTETIGKIAEAKPVDNRTAAQTTKRGVRVAHVPQVVPQLVRPEPLQVSTQKFPLNVRQYYVNIMHDICVQIYTNGEDAAQRAIKEELACHEKCKALSVYKNSCMLAAHRLRKEVDQAPSEAPAASGSGMVSHEAVLNTKSKGSWSVLKSKKAMTDIKGAVLYSMLKKWILTEQQLKDNGFPRPHPEGLKGRAKIYVINTRNQTVLSKVPNERFCSRCGQAYMVDKEGVALRQQNCIYHWGRKFTIRGEGKYSCCQQYGSASGCCDAKTHVWDYTDYENLRGYVKTLPKDSPTDDHGVFALDCEMCYTTHGLELTRVTVIDEDCNVVYETLVKPHNPIIDHNTRFSGITEEDMKNVTTTLLDVQATLLTMFSSKTILIGHSLESDFKALKLLHDTVVDTTVMFPHKNGYPQKRALKNLCSEYLRKIIQNDVGGHDSKEDAVACMELIHWKVKEEAKLQ